MESKFKALRFALLMSAVGGASVVLVSASNPAQAGEQRLFSSSKHTYGLVPVGSGGRSERASDTTTGSRVTKSASNAGNNGAGGGNEPSLEDPPLPAYNGGNAPATGAAG